MNATESDTEPLHIGNYCVCFLDFLGQKNLLAGEGLMPSNKDEALAKFQKILTSVRKLHEYVQQFLGKELADSSLGLQRWSDGVVVFVSLGGPNAETATSAVLSILQFAASMLFFGLAAESPMRGGIDIAWGVELHRNELYGPAIANSYLLESTTAQYPRVVLGPRVIEYLQAHAANPNDTPQIRLDRGFAQEALSMLSTDEDGQHILNYYKWVNRTNQSALLSRVDEFVNSQLRAHQQTGNGRLFLRYQWLRRYLEKAIS